MDSRLISKELTEYKNGSKKLSEEYGVLDITRKNGNNKIIYYNWNIIFNEDINAERQDPPGLDEIQIMFNLNQDIEWNKGEIYSKHHEIVSMKRGEVCVYHNKSEKTSMIYTGGTRFKFKSLQMNMNSFRNLLAGYFSKEEAEEIENRICSHVEKTIITPEMYRILSEIDSADKYKDFKGIFLEGKMIELTSLVLYGIFYSNETEEAQFLRIDKDDVSIMDGLRESIQLRPYDDYSNERVTEMLGMSKSKLNRLFRGLYDTSLHTYVQEQRLEYAAGLLKNGEANVTEVAAKCGYNNLSHFAKAFARKYGITPKKYSKVKNEMDYM